MKQLHIKRLEKLATHLEKGKLGHKKFYFGKWNVNEDYCQLEKNGCGYAGCAIGEAPFVFPRAWAWDRGLPLMRNADAMPPKRGKIGGMLPLCHAEEFFGVTAREAEHLFMPYEQEPWDFGGFILPPDSTPEQVALNIRAFIKIKRQQMKQK